MDTYHYIPRSSEFDLYEMTVEMYAETMRDDWKDDFCTERDLQEWARIDFNDTYCWFRTYLDKSVRSFNKKLYWHQVRINPGYDTGIQLYVETLEEVDDVVSEALKSTLYDDYSSSRWAGYNDTIDSALISFCPRYEWDNGFKPRLSEDQERELHDMIAQGVNEMYQAEIDLINDYMAREASCVGMERVV